MEEQVYEMENMQLDMLNQLKDIQAGGHVVGLFDKNTKDKIEGLLGLTPRNLDGKSGAGSVRSKRDRSNAKHREGDGGFG